MERKWGWRPDIPDHRDFMFPLTAVLSAEDLPRLVDHRSHMPIVYDQGPLGSCVSQAIAGAIEFDEIKQKKADPQTPSRLFIYYNGRVIEGTTGYDNGLYIRDGIKSLNLYGYPEEFLWPYNTKKFASKPVQAAYADAKLSKVDKYERVPKSLDAIKTVLSTGNPVVFGIPVYEGINSDTVTKQGILHLPQSGERVLGGHAILLVGYDEDKQAFIFRNSWGRRWALDGYCYIDYNYVLNLGSDFWIITFVPQAG